jgi:C1A family cysteine protease
LAITSTALALYMFQGSASAPQKEHLDSFLKFTKRFGKTHGSQSELEYRYSIYLDNKQFIEEKNAQGLSFTLGENAFADLTFEEFASKYVSQNVLHNKLVRGSNLKRASASGSKDWRNEGKVTPVKNQGACGSCWAFSTIGSLESAYAIKNGETQIFSEMELVDCSGEFGNNGCNGGLMSNAFDYIKQNQIGLDSDYPYRPLQGSCHADKSKARFSINDYSSLPSVDVDGLITALNNQPVSVAIEVRRDFQLYRSGVYTSDSSCGQGLNHGVLAVGYNCESNDDNSYFIVKNSWGAAWGEEGYVRMAIGTGSGTCGIANSFDVYPNL